MGEDQAVHSPFDEQPERLDGVCEVAQLLVGDAAHLGDAFGTQLLHRPLPEGRGDEGVHKEDGPAAADRDASEPPLLQGLDQPPTLVSGV